MSKIKDSFSFVKHFKIFVIISIILVAAGVIGIVLLPFGVNMFNFDIDFLGGVTMQYDLHTEITPAVEEEIRTIVRDVTGSDPSSVTSAGTGTEVVIKTLEIDTNLRDEIFTRCKEQFGLSDQDLISTNYVSSSVGNDLRNSAIIATVTAVLLMLVYITIRFEFRSGLAAVISLLHDILVMLSVYVIFQIPFNMNFIAAALTILGYSINATIVVFDRVRENNKLDPKTPFDVNVDKSIWQTMNRSLNTTITTLLTITMILIFGVPSIQNFALPLVVGIVSGAYSSVCLSGPIWCKLKGNSKAA